MYPTRKFEHLPQKGFTLLELLIVTSIVLIMTSTIVLGFTGADRNLQIRTEAERFALLIELARSEALQENREMGVIVERQDYSFAVYDEETQVWQNLSEKPFHSRNLPAEMGLIANKVTEPLVIFQGDSELPDVVIFSDGEITPFEVELLINDEFAHWLVSSDGLSRTQTEQTVR